MLVGEEFKLQSTHFQVIVYISKKVHINEITKDLVTIYISGGDFFLLLKLIF